MAQRIIYWQQLLRETDIAAEHLGRTKSWEPSSDGPLFIRLQSRERHYVFDSLIGKVVRITVEVVDG